MGDGLEETGEPSQTEESKRKRKKKQYNTKRTDEVSEEEESKKILHNYVERVHKMTKRK